MKDLEKRVADLEYRLNTLIGPDGHIDANFIRIVQSSFASPPLEVSRWSFGFTDVETGVSTYPSELSVDDNDIYGQFGDDIDKIAVKRGGLNHCVLGIVYWDYASTTGKRHLSVRQNGEEISGDFETSEWGTVECQYLICPYVWVSYPGYLQIALYQNSGTTLSGIIGKGIIFPIK